MQDSGKTWMLHGPEVSMQDSGKTWMLHGPEVSMCKAFKVEATVTVSLISFQALLKIRRNSRWY
jgi:hypothetical protein